MIALLITIVCLGASACFSGFENGMIAIRRARLEHAVANGSATARLMKRFLDRPALMLGTILLGNNLSNVFTAVYFDRFLQGYIDDPVTVAVLGTALLTVIVLIFGEVTPKVWFRQAPFFRCQLLIYPMFIFQCVTSPFARMLGWVAARISALVVGTVGVAQENVASVRESFRIMLHESLETGLIDDEAYGLLERAVDYSRMHVSEVMTARAETRCIASSLTLEEAVAESQRYGRARLPVYDEQDPDRWIGVFSVYDAMFRLHPDDWAGHCVVEYVRPAITIREGARLQDVLNLSQLTSSPLLVVVGRDGAQSGIVSANDVIPPLFGELRV
jgi:CBS domain containing-hemolysin-like protein